MHVTAPIPSMAQRAPDANVPPEIDAVVQRLLAKDAAARFVDAKELVETLDAMALQLAAQGRIAEPIGPMSIGRASVVSSPEGSGPRAALGTAPTGFAQPMVIFPARVLSSLTTSLSHALKSAPSWLTPRVVRVGGSSLGVLLLVLLISVFSGGSHRAKTSSAKVAASASGPREPPVYPPDPKIDQVLSDAQANIERANYATAIDELAPLEKAYSDRADMHALLERAYMGAHDAGNAIREADLWLGADPNAASHLKLEEDVRNAALVHETQDAAFALLESRMGPTGVDLLYDIAYGVTGRLYPQAAVRAKRSLELSEVREHAGPGLRVLLAMHDAKTCEQKRELLDEARDSGDARLLPVLQPYESTRGCGFFGRSDCYPCLHRDHALHDAIHAIEDRASK